MRARAVLLKLILFMLVALAGCAGSHKQSLVPPQTVEMDAHALKKFQGEVEEYVELRKKVLAEIPAVTDQSTAEEVAAHQRALTSAIIASREEEKQGEIFEPEVEAALRRTLLGEFSGPDGPALIRAIEQSDPELDSDPAPENPTKEVTGQVTVAVNAVYNDAAQFSSVPPSLLLKLPLLPEVVRYQFVGRALILRDTEANVIIDFIQDVVPDPSIPR